MFGTKLVIHSHFKERKYSTIVIAPNNLISLKLNHTLYFISQDMSIFRKKHNVPQAEEGEVHIEPIEMQEPNADPVVQEPTPFKTVAHINGYPLVQQTKEILDTIAVTRVAQANTLPTVGAILNCKAVKFVEPVTKVVDTVADSSLTLTEKVIPSLKTKTYQRLGEEIMIPYNLTTKIVGKTVDSTISLTEDYVYEPTHNQILKFRQYYNEKVYDTHGKPLVRGSFDPLVTPCNKWYEDWIKSTFPDGKEVPTNGFSNELDRSLALTVNLIQRALPLVKGKTKETLWAPCNYVKHVNDVLNQNLDKQEDMTIPKSWMATKEAFQELNQESIEYLKGISPMQSLPLLKKKKSSVAGENNDVHINETVEEGYAEQQNENQTSNVENPNTESIPVA